MKKKIPAPKHTPSFEDNKAAKEAESFANGDLEKEARVNAHQRKEKFRDHLNKVALILFWIIVSSFSLMAIMWVYHLITPEKLHILTALQIDKLQTILFSATAIKIGQDYLNRNI